MLLYNVHETLSCNTELNKNKNHTQRLKNQEDSTFSRNKLFSFHRSIIGLVSTLHTFIF